VWKIGRNDRTLIILIICLSLLSSCCFVKINEDPHVFDYNSRTKISHDYELDNMIENQNINSSIIGVEIHLNVEDGMKSIEMKNINPYFIYSSYLGGSDEDYGRAISVDSQDNIIVTGDTESTDFPTLNAYDDAIGGTIDAFISKFASDGTLLWSTYLGGSSYDCGNAVSVDSNDNIIVTGYTGSIDFPTLSAYDNTYNDINDAFITKFSSDGTLLWSTYLGGSSLDFGYAISVDSNDNVLVTGYTMSFDFPTLSAYDNTYSGIDAFITKFSSDGTLLWSTYLGGSIEDYGDAISVDSNDNIIVTGYTGSIDFPTLNAYQNTRSSLYDGYIAKFSSNGTLLWSSYLGGSSYDYGNAVSVDSQDDILVSGYTESTDFPTLNAYDDAIGGTIDAFITKFASNGTLLWSSYLGGSIDDYGRAISVDSNDTIIITGYTESTDFPTLNAYDDAIGGTIDAFITKFSSNGTLLWSTYLGGGELDNGYAVGVDSNDNIIVGGFTGSIDFPTLSAYNNTNSGLYDVFITKFLKLGLDNDNDFMPDGWEDYYGLNTAINDADDDYDGDGLSNIDEYNLGTVANNNDSDGDLMTDGWEVDMGLNPALDDSDDDYDGDGLTNLEEYNLGTMANNNDSDGDLMTDGWEVDMGLNPALDDSDDDLDGDGMPNIYEFIYGLNAALDDADDDLDGDGMPNIYEFIYGLNTTLDDADDDLDGDGLSNLEEYNLGTMANNNDSDGDTIPDGWEVRMGLNATLDDTADDNDADGMPNLWEYKMGLNPSMFDSNFDKDSDGMFNLWEYQMGLNATHNDAYDDKDGDGLQNLTEFQYGLNASNPDTDYDNLPDAWEFTNNLDYLNNNTYADPDNDDLTNILEYLHGLDPNNEDTDGDQMTDGWEVMMGLNALNDDSQSDGDSDGIPNLWEFQMGLNATLNDANLDLDGDGMPNLWEYQMGLNANYNDAAEDKDADGLSNLDEYLQGLDASNPDTDGDGALDGDEVAHGRDPHSASNIDRVISDANTQALFISALFLFALLFSVGIGSIRKPDALKVDIL
jgi:hypothetical protein